MNYHNTDWTLISRILLYLTFDYSFETKGTKSYISRTLPKISFQDNIKILIGENGLGKTTVLNILYYTITKKFRNLRKLNFHSIHIEFANGEKAKIIREKIGHIRGGDEIYDIDESVAHTVLLNLSKNDIKRFTEMIDSGDSGIWRRVASHPTLRHISRKYDVSGSAIFAIVKEICGFGEGDKDIKAIRKQIDEHFGDNEVLYFPTFRRIEEDLFNLGFDEERLKLSERDNRLIQFGMRDVRERIEKVKSAINILSSQGLSQISSEILSQLVKGVPDIEKESFEKITKKDIEIILARVGDAISKEDKLRIIDIVSNQQLKGTDDKYLIYFLQKLINIYEEQKAIDISIENFVKVCNEYLKMSKKEIVYEASKVEFYLLNQHNNKKVLLDSLLSKLSSGEKQIISLFSKIFLETKGSFLVLFDEPELSLSIFWQKRLLTDILSSQRCKFLISVTHSPFIFENELEKHAIGLNEYTKFYKK